MKKMFLITLFAAAAISAFAQTERVGNWAIEFPDKKEKAIEVSQTFTPYFEIKNEERVFNNNLTLLERDMSSAKHWLSIDVVFYTNTKSRNANVRWPKWLDNTEVEVSVLIPASDESGNLTWAVLGGKQTLASLPSDGKRHFVRMMIPPEIIYRYFNIEGTSGDLTKDYSKITTDLKRISEALPVMVTVTYRGRPVTAYQVCGREIFNRLEKSQTTNRQAKNYYTLLKSKAETGLPTVETMEKLNSYISRNKLDPQVINYLPDALLPVSKTPFAWVLFDRFEAIKETSGK